VEVETGHLLIWTTVCCNTQLLCLGPACRAPCRRCCIFLPDRALLLHFVTLSVVQHSPDACPPTGAERRKFYSRTTTEALHEVQQHQHKGAHPYRVVLGEVRHMAAQTGLCDLCMVYCRHMIHVGTCSQRCTASGWVCAECWCRARLCMLCAGASQADEHAAQDGGDAQRRWWAAGHSW
jgi:hypothetical protein